MADKTGSTGDSSGLHLLWIYAVCQTSSIKIRPRLVSPIWPWTMSSTKVFIRKLVELPMKNSVSVRDPELDEKRQSQQIDDFSLKSKCDCD